MTTTSDFLGQHGAALADKLAVVDDRPGGEVRLCTFAELDEASNRLANALIDSGVGPGDRVGWLGKNSIEVAIWLHAARRAKAIPVPLGYRLTEDELAYVIADSEARVVLADAEHREILHTIRPRIPVVSDVVVFAGEPLPGQVRADDLTSSAATVEPQIDADAGGSMIYTSGTTGRPKGALRRGGGDPEQTARLVAQWGCHADDIHVTCGPLYHSGPLMAASIAHLLGNTLVVQRNFDAEDWLRLIDRYGVTATFSAPTPIRRVTSLPPEVKARYNTSTMRMMLANAAPWPFALKLAYLEDFPAHSLYEIYGATELGVCCTLMPEDQLRKPGSCGTVNPLVELALFAEDGTRIDEPNMPGELFARAASVLDTYHNAPDKFDEEHRGEWHTVGDIAYVDDEGYYFICDRKKDMIISGGMNIYPAEIEAVLEADPRVYEAAVIGLPSDEWGEAVHAVVVTADAALDEDDVVAIARASLSSYKAPRSVSFVDEIPKTGTNKILKRELRDQFLSS